MVDIRVTPEGTTEFNESPIGTGPFEFVSWEPNRQLTYERNDDYWADDLPYLDGLEIRTIPDSSVQVIQLINGEIDFITQAPFGQIAQLVNGGMAHRRPARRTARWASTTSSSTRSGRPSTTRASARRSPTRSTARRWCARCSGTRPCSRTRSRAPARPSPRTR
jgi:MarR-like DNA-binding transcriptional regulator SgrR of sgrS sRNA